MSSAPAADDADTRIGLPYFADNEAVELDAEVTRLRQLLAETQQKYERVVMSIQELRNGHEQTTKGTTAVEQDLRTVTEAIDRASHERKLAERQIAQIQREIRQKQTEQDVAEDSARTIANDIVRLQARKATLQARVKAGETELATWRQAQDAQRDDEATLQRYAALDDAYVAQRQKELKEEQARERTLRTRVEELSENTILDEMQLQSANEQLRTAVTARLEAKERHRILMQQLEARRHAVDQLMARRTDAEQQIEMQAQLIDERQQRVEEAEDTRKQAHLELATVTAATDEAGQRKTQLDAQLGEIQSVLMTQRSLTQAMQDRVAQARINAVQARNRSQMLKDRVTAAEKRISQQSEALNQLNDKRISLSDALAQIGAEYEQMELSIKQQRTALEEERQRVLGETNELQELAKERNVLSADMTSLHAERQRLNGKVAQLKDTASEQQTHLYHAEFRLQRLHRQLAQAQGTVQDDASRNMRARSAEYESRLSQALTVQSALQRQVLAAEADLRRISSALQIEEQHVERADERVTTLLVEVKGAQSERRRTRGEVDQLLIKHDDVELRIDELRRRLAGVVTQTAGREQTVQQEVYALGLAVQEATGKVDVKLSELRLLQTQRARLAREITSARQRAQNLTARYTVLDQQLTRSVSSTNLPSGKELELGSGPAVAQEGKSMLLRRVTQRRMELQARGDELNEAIEKGQRINEQLEQRLDDLMLQQRQHRRMLRPLAVLGAEGSQALQELQDMQRRASGASSQVLDRKRELAKLQGMLDLQFQAAEQLKTELALSQERTGQAQEENRMLRSQLQGSLFQLAETYNHYMAMRDRLAATQGEVFAAFMARSLRKKHNREAINALLRIANSGKEFALEISRLVNAQTPPS